jgi:hypothetical protein
MPIKIEEFLARYPDLKTPPPQTQAVVTTREDDGFFPVFCGRFRSQAAQGKPDVLIVGRDWGDAETALNRNSPPESLDDRIFRYLGSWLGFSELPVERFFFTNIYHFVHIGSHTGNEAAKVYEKIHEEHQQYVSACHNVLRDTIHELEIKVVVMCGLDAIRALRSCPYFAPTFPRLAPNLQEELLLQEQEPFYVGQIAGRQITLFVSYHWAAFVLKANAEGLRRTWHSIGQRAKADQTG